MAPDYGFDLGTYRRPVSTASSEAASWFTRGLIWTYGFNHEEAIRCFERAIGADPGCALAHWGVAYAIGPNYNKPWEAFEDGELSDALTRAHAAINRAVALDDGTSGVERSLITALTVRYPSPGSGESLQAATSAYAAAMGQAYGAWPDDLDVAALYADALMNVTAWSLWDLSSGAPAEGAHTLEARTVLETALGQPGGQEHPGLLHLYIHLMEMSPWPEVAEPAADALRDLVPDAGHLVHMPTHIDVLVGDYARVISSNELAIAADDRFAAVVGDRNFYTLYRAHNHHFRIYGAMFAGRRQAALEAAAALVAAIPEELLRVEVPPMADWLESFIPMRLHVLIRFGMWAELIAEPLPEDPALYCVTTAMSHYAKGVAYAATGQVGVAEASRASFRTAVEAVPDSRYLFNNTARDILAVASAMLDGEIAYRQADYARAWSDLERAIHRDDTLPYDEPWGWMQPARHAYGALLLEQGEVERAAAVYAADLGLDGTLPRACQHPNNVWSLRGYHECLTRLGRSAEAVDLLPQLARAQELADIEIHHSCFCATEPALGS